MALHSTTTVFWHYFGQFLMATGSVIVCLIALYVYLKRRPEANERLRQGMLALSQRHPWLLKSTAKPQQPPKPVEDAGSFQDVLKGVTPHLPTAMAGVGGEQLMRLMGQLPLGEGHLAHCLKVHDQTLLVVTSPMHPPQIQALTGVPAVASAPAPAMAATDPVSQASLAPAVPATVGGSPRFAPMAPTVPPRTGARRPQP